PMTTPALFTEYTIRSTTFRNRLWVAPMCEYSVDKLDGVPTSWHLVHLGAFARGGAGLVMTEASAVVAEGRISPQDTGIWNDAQRDAWAPIVEFIHSQGAAAAIQLAHAGRKASTYRPWADEQGSVPVEDGGWVAEGPSAIAFTGYAKPRALDQAGIEAVIAAFASAARRSVDAGFDVLELHAAHGYLLHQFLSPLSNTRTDGYGGSLENRARLLLEVIRAVRAEVGETVPLFVRFSATDYAEGGWDQQQTATVAGWAKAAGADFFDVSSGGLVSGVRIPLGPGYQVPLADFVKHESSVEVSAVGLITAAQQAEDIVASGQADAVMMAREIMRDPHFALRAAHELGYEPSYWPSQYLRARWS
ncbi:MAG: oxidoreductase, partial [Microbacteriaceae bacterium]|nr:oxidoreductase [Microbacteriaceae bacterium]